MTLTFQVSPDLQPTYPGTAIGLLVMRGVTNPQEHSVLTQRAADLESRLREQFGTRDRAFLKELPAIQAYEAYYKRFKKSYHVRMQLESVAIKGKSLPRVGSLVQVMFMAELQNHLLTAGHDADLLKSPVDVGVANGTESYVLMSDKEQLCKEGDMRIADADGVISSIVYGPDRRTRLNPNSRSVCYTVYGVPGIGDDAVRTHLEHLRDLVTLIATDAKVEELSVVTG